MQDKLHHTACYYFVYTKLITFPVQKTNLIFITIALSIANEHNLFQNHPIKGNVNCAWIPKFFFIYTFYSKIFLMTNRINLKWSMLKNCDGK